MDGLWGRQGLIVVQAGMDCGADRIDCGEDGDGLWDGRDGPSAFGADALST